MKRVADKLDQHTRALWLWLIGPLAATVLSLAVYAAVFVRPARIIEPYVEALEDVQEQVEAQRLEIKKEAKLP